MIPPLRTSKRRWFSGRDDRVSVMAPRDRGFFYFVHRFPKLSGLLFADSGRIMSVEGKVKSADTKGSATTLKRKEFPGLDRRSPPFAKSAQDGAPSSSVER